MNNKIIYLDNAATTKPYKEVLDRCSYINEDNYFNASALYHGGLVSAALLNEARNNMSNMFNPAFDLIFTSCGTESDNISIFSYTRHGNSVTTLGEHPAVYNPFNHLKMNGYDTRFASLNTDGSVNIDDLLSKIDNDTRFVSVVHVNNETGAINDINLISKLVKEINPKVIFHSDGVQAFGKIPTRVDKSVDLYSCSAHKINGFKGVGGLFKNKSIKNLKPLMFGGGQEGGLRSGTENLYGIKVFEEAYKEHFVTIKEDYERIKNIKEEFKKKLDWSFLIDISGDNSSPYILCFAAPGLRGEVIQHMMEEKGVVIGTGSACSSSHRYSRMLSTISKYDNNILEGVVRISFCRDTTMEEAMYAAKELDNSIKKLRSVIEG